MYPNVFLHALSYKLPISNMLNEASQPISHGDFYKPSTEQKDAQMED